jgi:hypothetical protein
MESPSFLGSKVPLEVKKLLPILPKLKQQVVSDILKLVLEYMQNENDPKFTQDNLEQIATKLALDVQTLSTSFTGFFVILRAAIKSKVKPDQLQKELENELQFPEHLSKALMILLKRHDESYRHIFNLNDNLLIFSESEKLAASRFRLPSLKDLKWKVDVSVSSPIMTRAMKEQMFLAEISKMVLFYMLLLWDFTFL